MPGRESSFQRTLVVGKSLIKKEEDIEQESMNSPRSIFTLLSSGRNNPNKQLKKSE